MNKEELVQEVSKKAKVTQKEAAEVVNALMETIEKTVAKGKKLLWSALVLSKQEKEQQEQAATLKQVKKSKSQLKQFLLSLPVKNSKKLLIAKLAKNSFLTVLKTPELKLRCFFMQIYKRHKKEPSLKNKGRLFFI